MAVNSENKPKRRGRPPGSKNKKKSSAVIEVAVRRGRPRKVDVSLEGTIRQLLSLPANAETKIRLISAAINA